MGSLRVRFLELALVDGADGRQDDDDDGPCTSFFQAVISDEGLTVCSFFNNFCRRKTNVNHDVLYCI